MKVYESNLLEYIIHTKIGQGPQQLPNDQGLLDSHNGLPKKCL